MGSRCIVPRLWPRGNGGLGAGRFAASLFSSKREGLPVREPKLNQFMQLRYRFCRRL
jgi:hypothetical protein